MSLKEKALKLLQKLAPTADSTAKAKQYGNKALEALSLPQKYASNKLAQAAGLKPESTSQENFAAIANVIGDKLGVPRDSALGNAAKAGGVALAETFADPLGAIPIGKIAKGVKGSEALLATFKKADKLNDLQKLNKEGKLVIRGGNQVPRNTNSMLEQLNDTGMIKVPDGLPNTPGMQRQLAAKAEADLKTFRNTLVKEDLKKQMKARLLQSTDNSMQSQNKLKLVKPK